MTWVCGWTSKDSMKRCKSWHNSANGPHVLRNRSMPEVKNSTLARTLRDSLKYTCGQNYDNQWRLVYATVLVQRRLVDEWSVFMEKIGLCCVLSLPNLRHTDAHLPRASNSTTACERYIAARYCEWIACTRGGRRKIFLLPKKTRIFFETWPLFLYRSGSSTSISSSTASLPLFFQTWRSFSPLSCAGASAQVPRGRWPSNRRRSRLSNARASAPPSWRTSRSKDPGRSNARSCETELCHHLP